MLPLKNRYKFFWMKKKTLSSEIFESKLKRIDILSLARKRKYFSFQIIRKIDKALFIEE